MMRRLRSTVPFWNCSAAFGKPGKWRWKLKNAENSAKVVFTTSRSILPKPDLRSGANFLACEGAEIWDRFLDNLSREELLALPFLFEFWAMPHQLAPEGDWKTWVILGGRGAGKTRAGAEWVRSMVEGARPLDVGKARRIALVGETIDQVREVMVFGESGILACTPPDRRPEWQAGRKQLLWPNGAVAQVFSAHDPESLRGPQFDAAWVDGWRSGKRQKRPGTSYNLRCVWGSILSNA